MSVTVDAVTEIIPKTGGLEPGAPEPDTVDGPVVAAASGSLADGLGPSLEELAAHVGYRISYRNRVPYKLPGTHLLGTLIGAPVSMPGTGATWVPIRPYFNLVGRSFALIHPSDIRTIFTTTSSGHATTRELFAPPPATRTGTRSHTWTLLPAGRSEPTWW